MLEDLIYGENFKLVEQRFEDGDLDSLYWYDAESRLIKVEVKEYIAPEVFLVEVDTILYVDGVLNETRHYSNNTFTTFTRHFEDSLKTVVIDSVFSAMDSSQTRRG